MTVEGLNERMSRVEEGMKNLTRNTESAINNIENRMKISESKNELLIEMKSLVTVLSDQNREQNERMKEFSSTLFNVNENLTLLNASQKQLEQNVNNIGTRVTSIEKSRDEGKVDIPKLGVAIVTGVFMLIPTAIGLYLGLR